MMAQREKEGVGEPTGLGSTHVETSNEGNSVGETPAFLTWPSRDIQKGLFMEFPKRNVHQDIVHIEVPQGHVQKRNLVAEVLKGVVEKQNSDDKVVIEDVENLNSVVQEAFSKRVELIGTGAKVVSVQDNDECRRILNDAGWNVSQSVRKNGKVQWYYRSPDGCLLGSLSTAMGKWRQMKEEPNNQKCGLDRENTLAKVSKSGSRRPPMNLLKGNLGFASSNHRAEEIGQRMEQNTVGHDNGDVNLISGTLEGTNRDTSSPGRNAEDKDSSSITDLNSTPKPGGADGVYSSPVANLTSKRNGMETDQLVLDVELDWNEQKRRKIQGSSSAAKQLGCLYCSSGVGFGAAGIAGGGSVSPMQTNSKILENRPQIDTTVKIEEDCYIGRGAYAGNAVGIPGIAPQPSAPPHANSANPQAWTDHSGDDVKEPNLSMVLLHPRSSELSLPLRGNSPNGSSPFCLSCAQDNRPLDLVMAIKAVKVERMDDQREAMDCTALDPNIIPSSFERTGKAGESPLVCMKLTRIGAEKGHLAIEEVGTSRKRKVLDRSNLLGGRNDDECRVLLKDAGWNVSQNLRKTGKLQWYYRSPDGCLQGSLASAMGKWRKMQEEQDCSIQKGNSAPTDGHETAPNSGSVRPRKTPKVAMQIRSPMVRDEKMERDNEMYLVDSTTSSRVMITDANVTKGTHDVLCTRVVDDGDVSVKMERGYEMDQREPNPSRHVSGDMVLMLEAPKGTHDTLCTRVVEDRDVSGASNSILERIAMESDSLNVEDPKELIQMQQGLDSAAQSESSIASLCREGPIQRESDSVDAEVPPMPKYAPVENREVQFEKAMDDRDVEMSPVCTQETSGGVSEERNKNWTCLRADIKPGHQFETASDDRNVDVSAVSTQGISGDVSEDRNKNWTCLMVDIKPGHQFETAVDDRNVEVSAVFAQETSGGVSEDRKKNWTCLTVDIKPGHLFEKAVDDRNVEVSSAPTQETSGGVSQDKNKNWTSLTMDIEPGHQFKKAVDGTNVDKADVPTQETSSRISEDNNNTCTEDIQVEPQSQLENPQTSLASLCQSTV